MKNADEATDPLEEITVLTEPTADLLNERQQIDFRTTRENCLQWLLAFGKDPRKANGYSKSTVKTRAHRMDQFYRWVWQHLTEGYTTNVTHDHADAWMRHLATSEYSSTHKSNCRKALLMLYRWRHHEHGLDEWTPDYTFSSPNRSTAPRDYLTQDERTKIREAALEHGSVPNYKNLSPEERDRWKAHLAQRFGKPKHDIVPDDWEKANGWKIPSLVATSLDAGLRPIEVERASPRWVDIDNCVLRISKEESSKNTEHWVVSLQDETAEMLDRWLDQRNTNTMYDDSDNLWLTREGNPYGSSALRQVLRRLCDTAGIDYEHRQMSWYAIRHSTGTYMTREEDLAATQTQLRHTSPETTMKYDQAPLEDRRDALNRM
jgi:site-specific recombinase XerD